MGYRPRHRQLGQADAPPIGILAEPVDHAQVALKSLAGEVRALAAPVVWREGRLRAHTPGEKAVGQGAVGEHADVVAAGGRKDVPPALPPEHVVRPLARPPPAPPPPPPTPP